MKSLRRIFMHRGSRSVALASLTLLVAASGATAAVTVTGSWGDPGSPAKAPTATIAPAVLSQLSVLARPAGAGDALPAGEAAGMERAFAYIGPNVSDARAVTASNGVVVHLIPASGGACVIGNGTAFCAPAQHLAGADEVDLCSPTLPPGEMQLEWVLPDHATGIGLRMNDGSAIHYPSGSNVYIATLPDSGPTPAQITWITAGVQHTAPSSVPAGAQNQLCIHPQDLPPASQLPHTTPGVVTDSTSQTTPTPTP